MRTPGGVRLSNDDDREVHGHEVTRIAVDDNNVKPHHGSGRRAARRARKSAPSPDSADGPNYPARHERAPSLAPSPRSAEGRIGRTNDDAPARALLVDRASPRAR